MKKLILGLALATAGITAQAQNGLESIVVEKYYVSNAADAAGSAGALQVGSVTYRIYADMLPGYNFQALYGTPGATGHTLLVNTSTTFFNNEDYGGTGPTISATNVRKNSALIDSWFSVGGAAGGQMGVIKSEDSNGSPGNAQGILQNNNPTASGPLNIGTTASMLANDGMIPGAPVGVTLVGISGVDLAAFDGTSQVGNSFSTNNGSIAALGGAVGPTAANRVLIGQFTSTGVLHFELNVQIGTPSGGVQQYVASNPVGAEISIPSLTGTFNAPNALPTVSITSPAMAATFLVGNTVTINATAADSDGTVDSVAFYVDGVRIGVDLTGTPGYTFNWTATAGAHTLTARATDNGGQTVTSSVINITVGNIIAPTVSITSPTNGTTFTLGNVVTINATAADADGTVDSVAFYVDGSQIGSDLTGTPGYTFNWQSATGVHALTARAYDNNGASTLSAPVSITVFDSSSAYVITPSSNPCEVSTICVPVRATQVVNDVIGYDVVLNYDKTKVTPTGVITVSNDLINPNYTSSAYSIDTAAGTMLISIFFNTSAPANTEFNGTGDVFCVEFVKTANFGSADTAAFTVPSLQESYFNGVTPKVVSGGNITTFQPTAYNASLKFWFDNSPIKYNTANPAAYLITNIYGDNATCNNLSVAAVQPDLFGNFTYDYSNGVDVNIKKDIPGTTSVQPVINGFDAFLTRRVLINDATFTPSVYQIIAMDVNLDGFVSSGDLSQINQRAVLIIPEFKQAWNYSPAGVSNGQPSKDWSFINGTTLNANTAYAISSTYPSNDGIGYSKAKVPVIPFCLPVPVQNQVNCFVIGTEVYTGILVGDVNGNFATASPNNIFRNEGTDQVVFDLAHATTNGNVIEIPVSIQSSENVNSLDFALTLNNGVTFNSIVNNSNELEVVSHFNAADNTLRLTSNSLTSLTDGTSLVRIRLNADQITASDLSSVAAYLNGDQVTARITGSDLLTDAISLYPNPSTGLFNVIVSENATIEVMNMEGRQVMKSINVNSNEKTEINIQTLAEGVYMVKAFNNNFTSIKRIVVKK
jgi:Bacterial Ig domain/Secretion system C-terminal sorting domain